MTLPVYPLAVRGLNWPVMKTHEFSTMVNKAPNFVEGRILNSPNPIWHFLLYYDYLKDNPADLVTALSPHTDYRYLEGFLLNLQGQFAEFLFDDLTDDFLGLRSQPGGDINHPSAFKVSIYPQQEFYYPLGSYIVDPINLAPHLWQVTQAGVSGSTVPAFSLTDTPSGSVIFHDLGAFSGLKAQPLVTVTDGNGNWFSPIQRNFGGQFMEDVTDLNTSVYPLVLWDSGVLQIEFANYTIHTGGLAVPGASYQGAYIAWVGVPSTGVQTAIASFYYRTRMESDSQDIENFLRMLWTIGGEKSKNGSGMLKIQSARTPTV